MLYYIPDTPETSSLSRFRMRRLFSHRDWFVLEEPLGSGIGARPVPLPSSRFSQGLNVFKTRPRAETQPLEVLTRGKLGRRFGLEKEDAPIYFSIGKSIMLLKCKEGIGNGGSSQMFSIAFQAA